MGDTLTDALKMLQEILDGMTEIKTRLSVLEGKATAQVPVVTAPATEEGLYRFHKPAVRDVSQWPENVDMTSPDANEAFRRALHGVNWRGGRLADAAYEEAWAEIEALKAKVPAVLYEYEAANLNPEFAGFGLLTGLIQPVKYDGSSFGTNVSRRKSYEGVTIQSFLDGQKALNGQSGTPGIG